jgi:hypothetical protein
MNKFPTLIHWPSNKIQDVQMKGIQNKKFISQKLSYMYLVYVIGKENSESFLSHARLMRMRQLVTFGELSNDVNTTGTVSMRVVASRVVISYGCPESFRTQYGHQPPI